MRMAWSRDSVALPWGIYGKAGVMVGVFYLNYFVLVERNLVRRHRIWRFILLNLLVICVALVLTYYIGKWGWPARPRHRDTDEWRLIMASISFILRDAVMLLLTISLAVALRLSGRWMDMERHRQQLVTAQRESELAGLRSQLNPHFLFNTLNSIYALIEIDPARAAEGVHELSQLLRYVVYENPSEVSVGREVDFVRTYIALMRLRMSNQEVEFRADISPDAPQIAPLLFVTLVENAFKHGVATGGAPIRISIHADAHGFECRTDNGFNPAAKVDKGAGGVGLSNLRRRLELLYGSNASLTTKVDGDNFKAVLKINKDEENQVHHS